MSFEAASQAKFKDAVNDDIESLLSPKAVPSEDTLFASPTAEGRLDVSEQASPTVLSCTTSH